MAGGGSVLNMIKTLKANRSMLKKRKPMTSGKSGSEKTLVDHKSFSEADKKEYYAKLAEEKAEKQKEDGSGWFAYFSRLGDFYCWVNLLDASGI